MVQGEYGDTEVNAFPPEPPADPHDPAVVQAHDWQAFRSLRQMANHWNRSEWSDGRRSYHWMLTFDDPGVGRLAEQCQEAIASPLFDPVPLDALHLTVGRVGFTDQLPAEVADAVAEAGRLSCAELTTFDLSVGPLAGSRGALRFSVSPWSSLVALHRALAGATQQVLGSTTMATRDWRPHLSIAYANDTVPVPSLLPTIVELRGLPLVRTVITSVALVELRIETSSYRYKDVTRLPLGVPKPESR